MEMLTSFISFSSRTQHLHTARTATDHDLTAFDWQPAICRVLSRGRQETADPTTQTWSSIRPLISSGVCVSVRRITPSWGESVGVCQSCFGPCSLSAGLDKILNQLFDKNIQADGGQSPFSLSPDAHFRPSCVLDAWCSKGRGGGTSPPAFIVFIFHSFTPGFLWLLQVTLKTCPYKVHFTYFTNEKRKRSLAFTASHDKSSLPYICRFKSAAGVRKQKLRDKWRFVYFVGERVWLCRLQHQW